MKIKINIRLALLIALAVISLLFIGYKYYEWNTLQTLSSLYNQTWTQELNLVQQENKNYNTYSALSKKVFDKKAPKDSLLTSYSELTGDLKLAIVAHENYLNTIKQNQNAYSGIFTFFLVGQRGDFARKVIDEQLKYYGYEVDDANIDEAAYWLNYNLLTAWKDMAVVGNFTSEIGNDAVDNVPKYFGDISSIEKYTNNDFQFDHASDIQKYYPDGYTALNNYKNFFSNYYSTAQDYDTGDTTSVVYTFSSLKDSVSNLGFNTSDLYKQENDHFDSNTNSIIQLISDQSLAIKNFESKKLYKYPLLSNIGNFDDDLVLCQLYDFKAGSFHSVTTNYVKAQTPSELLNELSSIPPSTQNIDIKFNKSAMKLLNNDKEIQFTCFDSNKNEYQFTTLK